nr:tumor necrosis factor ligand superfamily member 12 [Osteobrama belangeri]
MQRKAIFQLILEKRELLESQRFRRDAGGRKGNGRKVASHFEMGNEGVIKGWTEEQLNMSRAVHYNPETGTFKVERSGVYFLYCQVHFNENQSQYVKLEVSIPKGPLLQCIEGYGTTPASGSHKFHFLKPCQVSGLLRLNKGAELKAVTGGSFSLQMSGKHYFGLFKERFYNQLTVVTDDPFMDASALPWRCHRDVNDCTSCLAGPIYGESFETLLQQRGWLIYWHNQFDQKDDEFSAALQATTSMRGFTTGYLAGPKQSCPSS